MGRLMPEIIFNGPAGRLEGRYKHSSVPNAPLALILHPNPEQGGTMNSRITYHLFQAMADRGFSVLRFNFRGVGRSQGMFDRGEGELSDAAAALDWMQDINQSALYMDRRFFFWRLDRYAAFDAPSGDRRFHLGGAAFKSL